MLPEYLWKNTHRLIRMQFFTIASVFAFATVSLAAAVADPLAEAIALAAADADAPGVWWVRTAWIELLDIR